MKAVIFDVDGTLIDSVDLHGKAWQDALKHFGKVAEFQQVRDQIGKGGNELLPEFLSKEEIEKRGEQIKAYRSEIFRKNYLHLVKPFPMVRELFVRIKQAGKAIAIGSSAKERELDHYLSLLNVQEPCGCKTCADDTERAKPHPDIFQVALEKLRVKATQAIVIGDSPYDAEAASKAGIRSIGFLCGGFKSSALLQAGMLDLYKNPEELLTKYSQSIIETE